MNLYEQASANRRKTVLYLTGFFLLVIALGWVASWLAGSQVILWIAVALSIAMSFSSYWFSHKLVLAMAHAKPIEKRDNPELYRLVENLSITAGLPMPKLYIMQDPQPNAFATGRNPEHGVVAVTTGILERLDRTELEGVLAHEMSHIGNRDMLVSTIAVVFAGIIAIVADLVFRMAFFGGLGGRDRGGHPIVLVIGIAALVLAPIAAQLIKLAVSRKREFLADASGALLTRYPEGLARALEKISADPRQLRTASDATAHLYLVNPFRGREKTNWIHKLFMTHPPVEDRVQALRAMH